MAVAERQDTFAALFEAFRGDARFGSPALGATREAAFRRFAERGFPTTRDEEWRFTNVAPIAQTPFQPASGVLLPSRGSVDALLPGGAVTPHLVMVDGRLVGELSSLDRLPAGITARVGHDTLSGNGRADATPFVDLNAAFVPEVLHLTIAPKAAIREPLVVLHVATVSDQAVMASPRIAISASEGCEVTLIEIYAGDGVAWTNAVTDVRLGPGAFVDHVKIQRQGERTFHTATLVATLGRAATFRSHAVTMGARIARNDIFAVLDGEGAECTLNGLYVAQGHSLVDTHTTIDHAKAHCPSHEVYRGILAGHARAVFNGKIIVRPDAQKTNAKQTNRALLLTDDAQINTKPQLEIFADDVKCTHGAAIGQLDEDALFYLRARGIGAMDARNMLIHAFAGDVLNGIRPDAVRRVAMHLVDRALGTGS